MKIGKNQSNYGGIILLNTAYKIYSKIITRQLNALAEVILSKEQQGFHKNRTCVDCVFTISQIIEKHSKFNVPTYLAFIDYVKAFDKINRGKLWTILKIKVKIGTTTKDGRKINQGVRQECPLSPTLFNFYIDHVISRWINETKEYFKDRTPVRTLLYADDQVIIANLENTLQ